MPRKIKILSRHQSKMNLKKLKKEIFKNTGTGLPRFERGQPPGSKYRVIVAKGDKNANTT